VINVDNMGVVTLKTIFAQTADQEVRLTDLGIKSLIVVLSIRQRALSDTAGEHVVRSLSVCRKLVPCTRSRDLEVAAGNWWSRRRAVTDLEGCGCGQAAGIGRSLRSLLTL